MLTASRKANDNEDDFDEVTQGSSDSSSSCPSDTTVIHSKESKSAASAMAALGFLWGFASFAAVICSFILAFGGYGQIRYKVAGVLIAFLFGPFYFIYLGYTIATRKLVFKLSKNEAYCKFSAVIVPDLEQCPIMDKMMNKVTPEEMVRLAAKKD